MIMDDHKKAVTTILRKRSENGEKVMGPIAVKPEISKTEDGAMDGRHAAMQDFMAAHHEGSAQKMADAMANFVDIHASMQHQGTEAASE